MKKIVTFCGVGMVLMWGHELAAQPMNYGANKIPDQQSAQAKDKQEYAEEANARLTRLKKNFGERTRKKDPFGANMDPGITPPLVVPVIKKAEGDAVEPPRVIPMQKVIRKIKPNIISATQQLIMIGNLSLKIGDPVLVECEGVLFKLRIIRIAENEVELINTKTQEKGIVRERAFNPNSLDENAGDILDKITKDEAPRIIR